MKIPCFLELNSYVELKSTQIVNFFKDNYNPVNKYDYYDLPCKLKTYINKSNENRQALDVQFNHYS